jgi:hypothetical protein
VPPLLRAGDHARPREVPAYGEDRLWRRSRRRRAPDAPTSPRGPRCRSRGRVRARDRPCSRDLERGRAVPAPAHVSPAVDGPPTGDCASLLRRNATVFAA